MKKIIRLTESDLYRIVKRTIQEVEQKEKEKTTQPKEKEVKEKPKSGLPSNIVIGDSQSPRIAKKSTKFNLISNEGGVGSLWMAGKGLAWLKNAVERHRGSAEVKNIAISIGTNGGFNTNDDVKGLVSLLREKFPNAKLFAVKGSWGWGSNKNITEKEVNNYYSKFTDYRVRVIEPAIGKNEPHQDLPVYAVIGRKLDSQPLHENRRSQFYSNLFEYDTISKKKAR